MRLAFLATATLCLCGLSAQADTLVYTVSSSFANSASVTGTLTLNNTTGFFTGGTLLNSGFPGANGTYFYIASQGGYLIAPFTYNFYLYFDGPGPNRTGSDYFYFNLPTLVGYAASSIPVDKVQFSTASGMVTATSATVTLQASTVSPAVTPEPSSLILLGTGLLGVTGVIRRRSA